MYYYRTLEIIVNVIVGIGTLGLAIIAYREVIWKRRETRPKVDVRIEEDESKLYLITENIGSIPAKGTVYMFIEPQIDNKTKDESIIRNSEIGGITDGEYENYLFAYYTFKLKPKELSKYSYPYSGHLEDICGKEVVHHFIRLEYSYESVEFKGKSFKYVSRYHMLPPGNNVNKWTVSRSNVNMTFKRYVRNENRLPNYKEYIKF